MVTPLESVGHGPWATVALVKRLVLQALPAEHWVSKAASTGAHTAGYSVLLGTLPLGSPALVPVGPSSTK